MDSKLYFMNFRYYLYTNILVCQGFFTCKCPRNPFISGKAPPRRFHSPFWEKETKEKNSRDKASNMCPESDPSSECVATTDLRGPSHELQEKPESEEEIGRDFHQSEDENNGNQGYHTRVGIQEYVCAENASNCPRRSNIGNHRGGIDSNLGDE